MPGGPEKAYQRVQNIFERAAAQVGKDPCVAYLGPGSAGHYVNMVHNGIEYGIMQLIAETYDLMKRGLDLNDDQLQKVYAGWNQTELSSYLLDISAAIFEEPDSETGTRLIDVILDEAKQKGTGMWTSQDAMNLKVPIPTIDIAVAMRNLSAMKRERREASHLLSFNPHKFQGESKGFVEHLRNSLYAGMVITYAQGFQLLYRASLEYDYQLNLETVARIWRSGCIIRSALLEKIRSAYMRNPDLPNLLLDDYLGKVILSRRDDLEIVVRAAADLYLPAPGLMVTLGYLDAFRSSWLPANLIQAQRDYFGAHTYERIDAKGVFHTLWEKD
jgi:6-phosphogluconate dehydrogenase